MHFDSILPRDWKVIAKVVLKMMCFLVVFLVSANDLWGEIRIKAESLLEWTSASKNPDPQPLRPGKFEKFRAKASRQSYKGNFILPDLTTIVPGLEADPEFGYIKFSATGESAELSFFSEDKKDCECEGDESFKHSVKLKWEHPGFYTVTATIFDENGDSHDSVKWDVQVGKLTFEPLPDLPSNPLIPDPPSVQVDPPATDDRSRYIDRVGSDMTFEVQTTSDDGIASIKFFLEDSSETRQLIDEKNRFFPNKRILFYWPSFKVEYTWETPGEYSIIAEVRTKDGGFREVKWNIEVKGPNQPPTRINEEDLISLGSLAVGSKPGRVNVDEYFIDPEDEGLHFDEVSVNSHTPDIVTLRLLKDSNGFNSIIEIEPKQPGTAIFYATARERDGLVAMQSFTVLVKAEPEFPDLVVQLISVNKSTLVPGENFRLSTTVENQGSGESSPTTLRYLKWDGTAEIWKRIPDKTISISSLSANSSSTKDVTVTVPNAIGKHFYTVCVDSVPGETDPDTNCYESWVTITVQQSIVAEDVNRDGVVNIQDLVLVDSHFGETGENDADVNEDGIVNIADLLLVAKAMGEIAAAPSANAMTPDILATAQIQQWLTEARVLDNSLDYQRGIGVLEQLLAILMPEETLLLPNYPNPFNPETWIPYQLAEPAEVSLRIYAVDGTVVRTLVLGHQTAGNYQNRERAAYWDGKNALGESVASGLYFYTLTAGDFTATRKMLIRK